MKPDAQKSPRRPSAWRPLGIAVILSLALHVVSTFVFNAKAVTETKVQIQPPLVTFLSPNADAPSLKEFRRRIELADPSASSLPNANGFSRTTIVRLPGLPSMIETRRDDPQLLGRPSLDATQLMIVPEPAVASLIADHGTKQPAPIVYFGEELFPPFVQPRAESAFLISGPARERRLLSLVNIPTVRSPAPALPTMVRISVSPIGEVKFAVIEKGSGADDKDARAIDIIRRWRFQAVPDDTGDQWGTVSVYWAAEPVAPAVPAKPETNAPPTANRES